MLYFKKHRCDTPEKCVQQKKENEQLAPIVRFFLHHTNTACFSILFLRRQLKKMEFAPTIFASSLSIRVNYQLSLCVSYEQSGKKISAVELGERANERAKKSVVVVWWSKNVNYYCLSECKVHCLRRHSFHFDSWPQTRARFFSLFKRRKH